MESLIIWIFVFIIFFGGGTGAFVRKQLENRRRHQLEMKRLELDKARADADKAQAELTSKALDTRRAELVIEQFDRGITMGGGVPLPRLTSGVESGLTREITDRATQPNQE